MAKTPLSMKVAIEEELRRKRRPTPKPLMQTQIVGRCPNCNKSVRIVVQVLGMNLRVGLLKKGEKIRGRAKKNIAG